MASKKVLIAESSDKVAERLYKIVGDIKFDPKIALTKAQATSRLNTSDIGIALISENLENAVEIAMNAHSREIPFAVTHYLPMSDEEIDKFNKYDPITFLKKEGYKEIAQVILVNYVKQEMKEKEQK